MSENIDSSDACRLLLVSDAWWEVVIGGNFVREWDDKFSLSDFALAMIRYWGDLSDWGGLKKGNNYSEVFVCILSPFFPSSSCSVSYTRIFKYAVIVFDPISFAEID